MQEENQISIQVPKYLTALIILSVILSTTAICVSLLSLIKTTENKIESNATEIENSDNIVDNQEKDSLIISRTFESEYSDFLYTLTWNTDILTLSSQKYDTASENAPSFDISGGGRITLATGQIDSPGFTMNGFIRNTYFSGSTSDDLGSWLDSEPMPSSAGTNSEIYYFNPPFDECIVSYAVIKGLNEALGIRLEDCNDNDMKSSEAFSSLLNSIEINLQK